MLTTQRLTSLAFFYHDGTKNYEELTEEQKKMMIRKLPSFLEFVGYAFNFQTVLIGPLVFYNDYKDFITGENIIKSQVILKLKIIHFFIMKCLGKCKKR